METVISTFTDCKGNVTRLYLADLSNEGLGNLYLIDVNGDCGLWSWEEKSYAVMKFNAFVTDALMNGCELDFEYPLRHF